MTLIKKISAVFLSSITFTSASGLIANRFLKPENKGPAYIDWVNGKGLGGGAGINLKNENNDGGDMNVF